MVNFLSPIINLVFLNSLFFLKCLFTFYPFLPQLFASLHLSFYVPCDTVVFGDRSESRDPMLEIMALPVFVSNLVHWSCL